MISPNSELTIFPYIPSCLIRWYYIFKGLLKTSSLKPSSTIVSKLRCPFLVKLESFLVGKAWSFQQPSVKFRGATRNFSGYGSWNKGTLKKNLLATLLSKGWPHREKIKNFFPDTLKTASEMENLSHWLTQTEHFPKKVGVFCFDFSKRVGENYSLPPLVVPLNMHYWIFPKNISKVYGFKCIVLYCLNIYMIANEHAYTRRARFWYASMLLLIIYRPYHTW